MCQSADFTSKSVVLAKYNARAVLQSCSVLNLAAKLVMISYLWRQWFNFAEVHLVL